MNSQTCSHCGRVFPWRLSTPSRSGQHFCSADCRVGFDAEPAAKWSLKLAHELWDLGASHATLGLAFGVPGYVVKAKFKRAGLPYTGETISPF